MIRRMLLSAFLLVFFGAKADAAFMEVQGTASVDKGSGFVPAAGNMLLSPGDRVRVTAGCAQIIYDNGYLNKICKGQMAVVFSDAPQPAGNVSLKDTPVAAERTGDQEFLAAALLGIGIGTGFAVSNNGGSSTTPVSP